MATKKTEWQMTCIVGDINQFYAELIKFESENEIHERHFTSQMVQLPNPNYMKGITTINTPEFMTSVLISCVIFFNPKKSDLKPLK